MGRWVVLGVIISYFASVGFGVYGEGPEVDLPDFVGDEIIVKFAESVAGAVGGQLKVSQGIDQLNAKYGVKEVRQVFKGFKNGQLKLAAMQSKSAGVLSEREKHILQRLKRGPANAKVVDLSRIYKVKAELKAGQSLEEMVAEFSKSSDVEYAELNYIVLADVEPDDRYYPIQWALNNTGQWYQESGRFNHQPGKADCDIDAPQAWEVCSFGDEVVVAVVDTGVDYRHRDLVNQMWADENGYHGYDFVNGDNDPMDDRGHGTHCAGIIAAEKDNNFDIAGVCSNAKIMAVKYLNASGQGETIKAAEAFYYAVDNGADIISCSFGSGNNLQSVQDAVDYAYSQGVVIIASAGNSDSNSPQYPADYDHVISVAATDSNDNKASFSNYGSWVDVAGPGVDILSLRCELYALGMIYDNYTTILSGTSMACPYVAGAAAELLSIDPSITVDQLETLLEDSADPIDPNICASGRLNLYNAIISTVDSDGRILLDRDFYSCSGQIKVQLFDSGLAGNLKQEITVSTNSGDSENVILDEFSSAAGVFVGSISIDSQTIALNDGVLQVSDGDIITATYDTTTDTAEVDCQWPVISNVHIDASGPMVKVTFNTNEQTRAKIRVGLDCGQYSITATDPVIGTSHEIELRFLEPETQYYFVIDVIDSAGNVTTDSNSSNCYSFTTVEPLRVPGVYSTIQTAINVAVEGDTVLVADGTYTGTGNRDIDFKGKSITVKSENGPENCIIDCQGTEEDMHRGFLFENREYWRAILDGFTVTKGFDGVGGGLRCDSGSSPTITNCWITGNTADGLGGGMSLVETGSSPTITNCVISNNTCAFKGGGVYLEIRNSPIISNCIISNNAIIGDKANTGGGMCISSDSSLLMSNCIISNNHSIGNYNGYGGAISIGTRDRYVGIINCTITGNYAEVSGGAIYCGTGEPEIVNSILWNNTASLNPQIDIDGKLRISHSNVQDGLAGIDLDSWAILEWGQGNIETDPCFVISADANDVHLSELSPCINAGDSNFFAACDLVDIDNTPRIQYGRVDIGADEYFRLCGPRDADIDNDGFVDFYDFSIFASQWLNIPGLPSADITPVLGDGAVDINDLGLISDNWLWIEPAPDKAINPYPENNKGCVPINTDLGWESVSNARSFNVYFGTDFNDVNNAAGDTFKGNFTNTFCVLDYLNHETDYYWRVDSVNAGGITKGDVWNFRTSDNSPISWWKFDDGSGSTALDSANQNHGTITGASWTDGKVGGALDFDGDGDYVDVGNDESLNILPEEGISIAVWVCPEILDTHSRIMISPLSFGETGRYVLALPDSSGKIAVKFSSLVDQVTTDAVLSPGVWTHIVATCEAEEQKIYVNGVQTETENFGSIFNYLKGSTVWIGGRQDNRRYFNGTLDDVRIYNWPLSSDEVLQVYHDGLN